jgi:hypothetical protein
MLTSWRTSVSRSMPRDARTGGPFLTEALHASYPTPEGPRAESQAQIVEASLAALGAHQG